MTLPARKFREVVLQLLYSFDLGVDDPEALIPLVSSELQVARGEVRRAAERVALLTSLQEELDNEIRSVSKGYALDRIHRVERNILRLGIYEILHDDEVPPKVAIAEALRLTRKFSTPEAGAFVNALLDAIYRKSLGETVDPSEIESTVRTLQQSEEELRNTLEE